MTEVLTYEALKADRDALAVENASLFAAAGEVYAAGYNHGHLNTVDGIAYTESVEVTFAGRGAQVMAEFAYPPIDNKDNAQLEALIAENASMKSAITTHSQSTHFCELCGKDDPCSTDDVCYVLNETPATDAALAAIRTDSHIAGLEAAANRIGVISLRYRAGQKQELIKAIGRDVLQYAIELREAK